MRLEIPTMKSQGAAKNAANNEAQSAAPAVKIDMSKVKVEPLFEEFVEVFKAIERVGDFYERKERYFARLLKPAYRTIANARALGKLLLGELFSFPRRLFALDKLIYRARQ